MSERLHKALKRMVDKRQMVAITTGIVRKVDGMLCDVDPSDGGPMLFDVRLKVVSSNSTPGAYAVPKVGSEVTVAMLDGNMNKWVVIGVETIKEYVIQLDGNAEIQLKPSGMVEINGTQYGGLVKVQELKTDLAKVNTFLNTLRQAIQSAPVAPNDGGASFKSSLVAAIASLQLPDYSQIESQKTKHGDL